MRNRSQKTAETLLLDPTKNKEKTCKPPDQTQEKGVWDAHAKRQNPSRFCAQAIANRSRKNAETSLLEPIRKKDIYMPKPCETAARKLPKRCFWNLLKTKKKPASYQAKLKKKVFGTRMRKSRTPVGFVPKPLRNRSRKNAETSLLEPIKKKEIVPKPCETAARKLPKRCFWNLLKTKKKRLPQARQTFAQRKTWKPASHQAKLKKKVFGTRMRKGRTPAGFLPKPLRNRSRKNAETSLLEPIKKRKK